MRWGLITVLLGSGCACLPAVDLSDYNRGNPAGLRIDVSMPVLDTDLTDESEVDSEYTAELVYEFRQHISDKTRFRLVWGGGLAYTIAEGTADADAMEVDYWGIAARYHLGLSYEFSPQFRVQLVPYAGAGVGYLEVDDPTLQDNTDDNYLLEYGALLHALYAVGRVEFGAGAGFTGRRGPHYLRVDYSGYQKWYVRQDYFSVHATVGMTF
ncbi:MAG: hypothetical protein ACOCZK_05655 [Planctomycetota bacterium]